MPALSKTTPILYISSSESYFAQLLIDGKTPELNNVTKIDAPLIKNHHIDAQLIEQTLKQLDVQSLNVIMSDEVFLHYIGDFPTNDKMSLEEHISNTVGTAFPDQEEPLHIVTLDSAKTARVQTVQITAITKENLQLLADAFHAAHVSVKHILPASFVVKAFVSIDPSLFMLESPTAYLLTSHYIGVEYAKHIARDSSQDLIDELGTLKETHPHLQHIYLSLSEDQPGLVTDIEQVFPTQSVKIPKVKAESDTPHVVKVLTLGFREVIENHFPFPQFQLPSSTALSHPKTPPLVEMETITPPTPPKPVLPEEKIEPQDTPEPRPPAAAHTPIITPAVSVAKPVIARPTVVSAPTPIQTATPSKSVNQVIKPVSAAQVISPATLKTVTIPMAPVTSTPADTLKKSVSPSKKSPSIGQFIMIAGIVAVVISLIGGGVVISQQAISSRTPQISPIVETSPSPVASPTPTPTPTPIAVDRTKLSILIVNATKKSGYAGKIATSVKSAGYSTVQTGNAKGTYEKVGNFVILGKTASSSAAIQLQLDLKDLALTTLDGAKTEDPSGKYDLIIVLNE